MTTFLTLSNNYSTFTIALFQDKHLCDQASDSNAHASKNLIPLIDTLLKKNNFNLTDIQFIAVNQGPGPFTTLRSILATANGLSFATDLPLIGVDGMKAFLAEHESKLFPHTVALLNAFNKDVYYGIQTPNRPIATGYKNYEELLHKLKQQYPESTIRFIGGGAQMHIQAIDDTFGNWAITPEPMPKSTSIEQIGLSGLKKWQGKKCITKQLMPLYLKKLNYKKVT